MKSITLILDNSIGCESIGDLVHIVLAPGSVGKAACSKGFIVANVTGVIRKIVGIDVEDLAFTNKCGGEITDTKIIRDKYSYTYILEYDDAQTNPVGLQLLLADVSTICCASCIDEHALDQGISQDLVTGNISHINGNCEVSEAVVISTDADNDITVGSDGGSFLDIISGYTMSNYTTAKVLDGATATPGDILNVLCTLIDEIQ